MVRPNMMDKKNCKMKLTKDMPNVSRFLSLCEEQNIDYFWITIQMKLLE